MSFVVDGGTIKQSGTDADLTGLEGLAGVTVFKYNSRAVYEINNKLMEINGTLSHDPEMEEMIFTNYAKAKTIVINGTYNLGLEVDGGAEENRFSSGTAIRFTRNSDSTYSENYSDIYIDSAGTMNWYGGTIFSKRQFSIYGHFNTYSQNAKLIGQHNAEFQVRQRSGSTNINGWVTKGYMFALITNAAQIKNYKPYTHIGLSILTPSSASPSNVFMTIEDFNSTGDTGRIVSFWSRKWMRLINNLKGTNVLCEGLLANNNSNLGLAEFTKQIKFNFTDLDGNALVGVKSYTKDTDNGKRLAAGQLNSNPDYIADRIYKGTSDANGIVDYTSILLGVAWRTQGGKSYEHNNYDYRGIHNDATDIFKFASISYGHDIKVQNIPMKGMGYLVIDTPLLPDFKITEAGQTVVDAYTVLDDAYKMYDYMKSYLQANFQGETETVVSRDGDQVDTRGLDFIIDSTVTEIVSYDDTSITINADEFKSGAKTTGIVSFNSGSHPAGGTFSCDVYVESDTNIDGMTVNGDLYINTGADSTVVYENVTVSGSVYNADASHTLTINVINCSITAAVQGSGAGEVDVSSVANFNFSVNSGMTNYEWRIYKVDAPGSLQGSVELAGEESASSDSISYQYSYLNDITIALQILPHGNDFLEDVSYHTLTANSQNASIKLIEDTFN